MIASAFLALLLLYSCHKERLGQYEPKKKISKIYRSNENTDRFLAEAWEWDNDRLSKIDHYSTLSYIFSEIYHYDSDGRIASIEDTAHRQQTNFIYNDKKLTRIDFLLDNDVFAYMTFTYTDSWISSIDCIITERHRSTNFGETFQTSLKHLLPAETLETLAETVEASASRHHAEAFNIRMAWDGANVFRMDVTAPNHPFRILKFEHDRKLNPYRNYLEMESYKMFGYPYSGLNKNNITDYKTLELISDTTYKVSEKKYVYTYKDNFPILQTDSNGNVREFVYEE